MQALSSAASAPPLRRGLCSNPFGAPLRLTRSYDLHPGGARPLPPETPQPKFTRLHALHPAPKPSRDLLLPPRPNACRERLSACGEGAGGEVLLAGRDAT